MIKIKHFFSIFYISESVDYVSLGSITFSANDTVGTIHRVALSVVDDRRVEADEIVQVMIISDTTDTTLHPVSTHSGGDTLDITIIDNDGKYVYKHIGIMNE